MRGRLIVFGAALGLLCACAEPPAPPVVEAPPPPPPRVHAVRDECGARELQRLVGHPRSEIPIPVIPSRQRVACTTCPVTQDYDPGRLNFFFDPDTGMIHEVRCG